MSSSAGDFPKSLKIKEACVEAMAGGSDISMHRKSYELFERSYQHEFSPSRHDSHGRGV